MTCSNNIKKMRQIRSFVRRDGRMTEGQRKVLADLWPSFGMSLQSELYDLDKVFGRNAPRILEIGFGSGHSLCEIAKQKPQEDFIGIEMYKPGIGTLLLNMEEAGINNIRVFYADAVEVLTQCIANESFDVIQLFFPDPWPKRKHHKRRLIQPEFINLLISKLKLNGLIHLATDWEDYAVHMLKVLSTFACLENLAGTGNFAARSSQRPVITKFEQRGNHCKRLIRELQFTLTSRNL